MQRTIVWALGPISRRRHALRWIGLAVFLSSPMALGLTIVTLLHTPVGKWSLLFPSILMGPVLYIASHIGSFLLLLSMEILLLAGYELWINRQASRQ